MISSNVLPQKRRVSRVHITFVDASSNYFIKNSPHTPRSLPFRLARSRLQSASFSLVNCRSMLSLKVPSRSRRCVFWFIARVSLLIYYHSSQVPGRSRLISICSLFSSVFLLYCRGSRINGWGGLVHSVFFVG